MKIEVMDVDIADLGTISQEQLAVRTPSQHVSSVINYIMTTAGMRDNVFSRNDLDLFAIIGRLWEQQLANAKFCAPRYIRPGEIDCDSIIGSPDAVDVDLACVAEFKATWKSSNRKIDSDFIHWLWQTKAYCHMLGLNRTMLFVLFVCGGWRPPVPIIRAYDITYTDRELKDNWNMLLRAAGEMK